VLIIAAFIFVFVVIGLPTIAYFWGDPYLHGIVSLISEVVYGSYFLGIFGFLHGFSFALGVGVKYGYRSNKLRILLVIIPIVTGISIVYDLLSYTFSPILEIKIVSDILNGIGVWGTIGIGLSLLTLSFDVFSESGGDAKYLGYFASIFNLTGLIMAIVSGILHKSLTVRDMWPLIVFNTTSYIAFLIVAIHYFLRNEFP
jgi:hypothetical protein